MFPGNYLSARSRASISTQLVLTRNMAWEDGGVNDPQILGAIHFELVINDFAHCASSDQMILRPILGSVLATGQSTRVTYEMLLRT